MIRNYFACVGGISLLVGVLSAQSPPGPNVRIRFSDSTKRIAAARFAFRKPDGSYLPAGGAAGSIAGSLEIPRPTNRPTDGLKALVWTTGCAIKVFDIAISDADIDVPFVCDPENTVTFRGRMVSPHRYSAVSAAYVGPCVVDERETRQCGLPVFVATANLEADGSFVMELPDFKADPIVSGDASATFKFLVKTPNEGWRLVKLEGSDQVPSVTVASSYPDDLRFVLAQ